MRTAANVILILMSVALILLAMAASPNFDLLQDALETLQEITPATKDLAQWIAPRWERSALIVVSCMTIVLALRPSKRASGDTQKPRAQTPRTHVNAAASPADTSTNQAAHPLAAPCPPQGPNEAPKASAETAISLSGTIINSPALAPPLDMEQHLQSAGGNTSTGERPIAHLLLFAVGACLGAGAFVCGTTSNIAGAVLLGIMALSFVGMGAHWQSKLCPQCHAYAAQEVSRQPIRSERIMMTSRTIDTHKDNHGNFIGSTDRKIVVPILVTDYTLNYRCTNCGHEWKRHDQEQEEERL